MPEPLLELVAQWPYLLTLMRLGLAVGAGVFVGLEREHRGKTGARKFAFAALLAWRQPLALESAVAANGAVLATLTSALVRLPLIACAAAQAPLTVALRKALRSIVAVGLVGAGLQSLW